jgi:hypothetical protein
VVSNQEEKKLIVDKRKARGERQRAKWEDRKRGDGKKKE